MKNKAASVFTGLALALSLLTSCKAQPQPEYVDPPFFRVADEDTGGCVYMLGSMHMGKAGTVYPEAVVEAFAECDAVACEVDTIALSEDAALMKECSSLLLCPEGTTTADYLGGSYEAIRSFMKKQRVYSAACEKYLPVMWSSMLSNNAAEKCRLSSDYGTEQIFLSKAKADCKEIIEIENALMQYELMAGEPPSLSEYSLLTSAENGSDELYRQLDELYSAWAAADGAGLEKALTEDAPEGALADEYDAYYDEMYTNRQRLMADCVLEWLSEGRQVFMFVGALHFYAEPDILTFLEESGYTCETLSAGSAAAA